MIVAHLLDDIAHIRRELALWAPSDDHGRRALGAIGERIARLDLEVARLERENAARLEEKRQLEIALLFTDDAVCVTSAGGEIRLINPAFERLSGVRGEENIGSSVYALWEDVSAAKTLGRMRSEALSGGTWRGRLRAASRDGEERVVEVTVEPIIGHDGVINSLVFTQRDITAGVKTERELSAQKELLEKILNLSSNAIMALDAGGGWLLDNLAAKTLITDLGPGGREALGRALLGWLSANPFPKRRKLALALANGTEAHYYVQAERIPGEYLFPSSSGESLFLVTMSDITELVRKNREITARRQAMASLKQEKILAHDEMANGVVCKMSQPLNVARAITGRMRTLIAENDMEGLTNNLALLQGMIGAMEALMGDFKKMSETDAEESPRCGIGELFEFAEVIYGSRAGEEGVSLQIDNGRADLTVPMAGETMRMAIAMLMDNAFDAVTGAADKRIRLRLDEPGDEIRVIVEDSGPGVPEEDRIRVFEPFFTTKSGRRGLSLALVNQSVNKAGGNVAAGASPLGGAAFSMAFPLNTSP